NGITYRTAVSLANLTDAQQIVNLTFIPESGLTPTSIQIGLSAHGALRDVIDFPGGGFKNGWVQVQSPGPIAGLIEVMNATAKSQGVAVVQPQPVGSTSMVFSHIANATPWATGLAFVNTTQVPATVEVFAINPNGTLIGGADNTPAARF